VIRLKKQNQICCLLFLIIASFCAPLLLPSGMAMGMTSGEEVEQLIRKSLMAQLELERHCLSFRHAAILEPRFRTIRYFAVQEAQASLQLAGPIVALREQLRSNNPHPQALGNAIRMNMTGAIIGAAGSAVELGAGGIQYVQHKRHKQDPTTAKNVFVKALGHINPLIDQLEMACQALTDRNDRLLYLSELRLLKYGRDQLANEFADWYADTRSTQNGINVFYLLNIASNSLAAIAGKYGVASLNRPRAGGPQVVLSVVADCIAIPSAPINTLVSKMAYRYWYRKIAGEIAATPFDAEAAIHREIGTLSILVKSDLTSSALKLSVKHRLEAYKFWDERFNDYVTKRVKNIRRLEQVAIESNLVGPALAGTGLAQDVMGSIGYFHYPNKQNAAKALSKAGLLCQISSSGGSLLMTTGNFVANSVYQRRLASLRQLPEQMIGDRLITLVNIEKMLEEP
jgi:hypothetical protein